MRQNKNKIWFYLQWQIGIAYFKNKDNPNAPDYINAPV